MKLFKNKQFQYKVLRYGINKPYLHYNAELSKSDSQFAYLLKIISTKEPNCKKSRSILERFV